MIKPTNKQIFDEIQATLPTGYKVYVHHFLSTISIEKTTEPIWVQSTIRDDWQVKNLDRIAYQSIDVPKRYKTQWDKVNESTFRRELLAALERAKVIAYCAKKG